MLPEPGRSGWRLQSGLLAVLGCVVALGGPCLANGSAEERLAKLRREVSSDRYEEPTLAELAAAEELFLRLFAPEVDEGAVQALLSKLGLESVTVSHEGEALRIVRDVPERRAGRGFFAFRRGKAEAIVLQAPHADSDLHTGTIAAKLFLERRAAAAAWNTTPRDLVIRPGEPPADMAHLRQSFLQAFTRAFGRSYPRGRCLQLHGFAASERKTQAAAAADAILSAGIDKAPVSLQEARKRLQCLGTVLLFPLDVQELGGTGNAQGATLQGLGHEGFVHLELGLELRRQLRRDRDARGVLWAAFTEGRP